MGQKLGISYVPFEADSMLQFRYLLRRSMAVRYNSLRRQSVPVWNRAGGQTRYERLLSSQLSISSTSDGQNRKGVVPNTRISTSIEDVQSKQKDKSRFEVDNAAFHNYTIQDLMNARVHMGHRKHLWNPNMAPYILGHRNGMSIINLDMTVSLLRRALTATSLMAENDCTFLWLGPRDVQKNKIIEKEARKAGAYTIDGARWIGGTLTNPIKSNQVQRFNYRIPDCVFVVDVLRHIPALNEARLVGIPTIGIVDSDCDPRLLTYPIPGNDDSALAIYLYCSLMKYAILDGRARGRRLNRPSFQLPSLTPGPTWSRSY